MQPRDEAIRQRLGVLLERLVRRTETRQIRWDVSARPAGSEAYTYSTPDSSVVVWKFPDGHRKVDVYDENGTTVYSYSAYPGEDGSPAADALHHLAGMLTNDAVARQVIDRLIDDLG